MAHVGCSVLLVAMVAALLSGAECTIECYSCTGTSGYTTPTSTLSAPYQHCGLPFIDNTTNAATLLTTVTCEGVCVTHVVFNGAAVPSTRIYRSCSDAPVTSGCEYSVSTGGYQQWSCIKTCSTSKCNTGSDGTMLTPSGAVQLLVLSAAAFVGGKSLF